MRRLARIHSETDYGSQWHSTHRVSRRDLNSVYSEGHVDQAILRGLAASPYGCVRLPSGDARHPKGLVYRCSAVDMAFAPERICRLFWRFKPDSTVAGTSAQAIRIVLLSFF